MVARFRQGKYGRFKKYGNFHVKRHRVSLKKPWRNTGDPVKWWQGSDILNLNLLPFFFARVRYLEYEFVASFGDKGQISWIWIGCKFLWQESDILNMNLLQILVSRVRYPEFVTNFNQKNYIFQILLFNHEFHQETFSWMKFFPLWNCNYSAIMNVIRASPFPWVRYMWSSRVQTEEWKIQHCMALSSLVIPLQGHQDIESNLDQIFKWESKSHPLPWYEET